MSLLEGDKTSNIKFGKTAKIMAFSVVLLMLLSVLQIGPVSGQKETIEVLSPNGGEEWASGSEQLIRWSVSDSGGFVSISLSTDNGKTYDHLYTLNNRPLHEQGSYKWKIPPGMNSTDCRIKVVWTDSRIKPITVLAEDESDASFTIEPDVVIMFTKTPTRMTFGKYYLTTYDLYDPKDRVGGLKFTWRIDDDGSGFGPWESMYPGFDYYDKTKGWIWWSIPDYYEEAEGQIKVEAIAQDHSTVLSSDQSVTFDIISPGVTLIQPVGGVTMVAGDTYRIKWYMSQDPEQVIGGFWIRFSFDGGSSWASSQYTGGVVDHWDWTVPNTPTTHLIVQVNAWYGEWYYYDHDQSSSNNTIITSSSTPSVTLEAPNPPVDRGLIIGGEEDFDIEWSLTGVMSISSMKIYYSTNNGSSWTLITTLLSRFISPYTWTTPAIDTYEGRVKLEIYPTSGPMKWVMSNHAFCIFTTIEFNRAPVVMDGEDESTTEGVRVHLDGSSAYDPDGDPLMYKWTQIQPDFIWADISNPSGQDTYVNFEGLTSFPVNFIIKFEVMDGYEHDDLILYNSTTYVIHVEPREPVLFSVTPDTGWEGTTVQLSGLDMMGADILFDGDRVLSVPTSPIPGNSNPDRKYNFTVTADIPFGLFEVTLSNLAGESSSGGDIEIFPSPEWLYDWGLGFTNPSKHTLSYPWDPTGTGRYRDAFGNQVYLTTWICIGIPYWTPWDGWECAGYLVDEPFCPDPLAAIFYGAVFHYMARHGECFGMSTTALQFYHGDLDINDYEPDGASDPGDLDHTGALKRHIEWRQGAQMSAEILNKYLYTLLNSLVPSSDLTGMGLWIEGVKTMIDSGELGVATMICDAGAHAVVPYAYEESGDKIRFYVYDSNRPEYSDPSTAISMCMSGNQYNDNPPYIEIDKSGVYWDWTFYSPGGTRWHSDVGLAYVPYSVINGDRTLPLSVEGIIHLLAGSAEVQVEDEEGNVSGVADNGSLLWGIEDAAPLPMFTGEGWKPQSYFLPDGNYTVNLKGNDTGKYNWSMINNGSSAFSIEDADVNDESNDTIVMEYPDGNPYRGVMTYGSDDEHKEYNASIIHEYGPRVRELKIIGGELSDDGEHGDGKMRLETNGDYTGLTFTNLGGGPTTFDVEFRSNVFSEEKWNGSDPPQSLASASRKNITVGPGETVTVKALDWLNLSRSLIILEGETVPGSVRSLNIESTGTQVELSWDPPLENGGWDILGYEIYRGNSTENLTLMEIVTGTSYMDDSVERGNTYYYDVVAFNSLGSGGMPGAVSILIPELTEPSAPLNLAVSESDGVVNITWEEPSDDGGSPILGYILLRGTTEDNLEEIAQLEVDDFIYTDDSIEAGNTYHYTILAFNEIGNGPTAERKTITISGEAEPPDGEEDDDDDDDSWTTYLIVVLILLAALILIGYLLAKGSSKGKPTPEE